MKTKSLNLLRFSTIFRLIFYIIIIIIIIIYNSPKFLNFRVSSFFFAISSSPQLGNTEYNHQAAADWIFSSNFELKASKNQNCWVKFQGF